MKKINVLKENQYFDRIIQNNKPFKCNHFLIYIERGQDNYHFGISVSKKICNAVGRNKLKRQIRNIIDKNKYQKDFNCIVIARKSILKSNYNEMEENLNYCFKKLKILEGENYEK